MEKIHYIATNRMVIGDDKGEHIDDEGRHLPSPELRFARYNSLAKLIEIIPDVIGSIHYTDPNTEGSAKIFKEIYERMIAGHPENPENPYDLLVYVHGYANDVNDIHGHLKYLHDNYVKNKNSPIEEVIVFYWTTNGRMTGKDYYSDQHDALIAGLALSRLMNKLYQFYNQFFAIENGERINEMCGHNIHLMCHSMGNQVLRNMTEILIENAQLKRTIKELVLIAPDTDNDLFEPEKPFTKLTSIAERVTIYYNKNDRVIRKLSNLANKKNRLGLGPLNRVILQNVYFVDATRVKETKNKTMLREWGQHWYHCTSQTVIDDINQVLWGRKDAKEFTNRTNDNVENYYILNDSLN